MDNDAMLSEYELVRTGGDGKGKGRVKAEDISQLQDKLFETLVYFNDFCNQYGIKYILTGGTCLGAARHQDFIPWDDDLDVAVLRKDYDKLFELWERFGDKNNFSLYRTTNEFCAYTPIGILRNNSTTFIRKFEEGLNDRVLGVKIDIEPMDEVPDNPIKRRIQKYFAYLYVLFLTQRKAMREKSWRKIGVVILLNLIRGKRLRNVILNFTAKQVKKYNGTNCRKVAINGLGYEQLRTDFTEPTTLLFHGKFFNVASQYNEYLTNAYGEYNLKPSVECRIPADEPVYYDLNTPYEDYIKYRLK